MKQLPIGTSMDERVRHECEVINLNHYSNPPQMLAVQSDSQQPLHENKKLKPNSCAGRLQPDWNQSPSSQLGTQCVCVCVCMQGHAVKGDLNRLEGSVQSPAVSTQEEGLRACVCVCDGGRGGV